MKARGSNTMEETSPAAKGPPGAVKLEGFTTACITTLATNKKATLLV